MPILLVHACEVFSIYAFLVLFIEKTMDVVDYHCYLIEIFLIEVVGTVRIDAFYLLLFLLFLSHCGQDLLETVEDESIFMV